ncbi:MAG: Lacal_2735 family protein [Lentimicrobium sp.]|jgi:hypothetical protein|nr:Lacal_2735 family protein [Lentimicrobium sp.]
MFGIFRKKSKIDLLEEKYQNLLKESYKLSTINRKASDEKAVKADQVLKEIEHLKTGG